LRTKKEPIAGSFKGFIYFFVFVGVNPL